MGVAGDAFDAVLTSGDVAQQMTLQRIKDGQRCFHVGPDKDMDLIDDAKIPLSGLEEADFILFTGMYDDDVETPDDYRDMMATWQARNLPVLCANPDRKVQMADKVIYCAGAVAELYEQAGGEVVWLGKPYLPVYTQAREKLAAMLDEPKILAVGDGPKTDIPGAANAGLDALFISGGLAGASGHAIDTPEEIAALLAEENTFAHYAMRHLVW